MGEWVFVATILVWARYGFPATAKGWIAESLEGYYSLV
jgi:hypothetical protein